MTKTRLFLLLALGGAVIAIFWPCTQFNPSMVAAKRVLVTGASSGIGEQLAYQYARAGASVFITARRAALLEKVIEKCKTLGSPDAKFGFFPADMEDMTQTTSVIEAVDENPPLISLPAKHQDNLSKLMAAVNHLGGLDQLVLNHAYVPNIRPLTNSNKSFHILKKTLDVNMRSFAHLALEAVPHLRETGGSIGVVNSMLGKMAVPLLVPYCASKFAVDGFFMGLKGEIKRHNISITMAVIGSISTQAWIDRLDDVQTTYKGAKTVHELGWGLASAEDCAYEIMRGTTMREREIYFPGGIIHICILFRELIVRVMDFGKDFTDILSLNPDAN